MTLVVTVLAVAVALLAFVVIGLLRSHAAILRKLHALGAGDGDQAPGGSPLVAPDVVAPTSDPSGRAASDLAGSAPDGSSVGVAVVGVRHDTIVAFLSTSCAGCETFWEELGRGIDLPARTRLVLVTKGPEHESPASVESVSPEGVTIVMSSEAWEEYGVPGSPYIVLVDGTSGMVRGEGTGGSWDQVAKLLAHATGDVRFIERSRASRPKARSDAQRERDTDRALLAAGISPGDPSLYQRFDGEEQPE